MSKSLKLNFSLYGCIRPAMQNRPDQVENENPYKLGKKDASKF
jgi:hypothetical protein